MTDQRSTNPTKPDDHSAEGGRSGDPGAGDQRRTRRAAPPASGERSATQSLALKIVRAGFFILFITVTLLAVLNVDNIQSGAGSPLTENYALTIIAAVIIGALIVAVDVFTPRKRVATLFAVFFAIIGGLVVTGALGLVVDLLARLWEFNRAESVVATIKVLAGICVCYLAIAVVLQTQDDFRLVIPYVEFAKQIRGVRPMLLDTSIMIDARIVDVAATGALQAPLVIPQFVIDELHALADSGDRLKRAKGRRGLAIVARLQRMASLDVSIDETHVPGKAVDQMLVDLAQQMPATVVTVDLGLARVAEIQNVPVLNLNDLAVALKAPVAAGDRITIAITREGEQAGQGVGYLDDGTMVVVEHAADRVGKQVAAEVTTSMQTTAGKLVFARLDRSGSPTPESSNEADEPGSAPDQADPSAGKATRLPLPPLPEESEPEAEPRPSSKRSPLGPGGRQRPTARNPRR